MPAATLTLREMVIENQQNELEKIVRKCEDLIICEMPKKKCEMRGDYWKCYMGNYTKCPIYIHWLFGYYHRLS